MPIPSSPVDLTIYNNTLSQYNESAATFDNKMSERDTAYSQLVAAQQTYDSADQTAQLAADDASEKLTAHVGAANDVGVPVGITPALARK